MEDHPNQARKEDQAKLKAAVLSQDGKDLVVSGGLDRRKTEAMRACINQTVPLVSLTLLGPIAPNEFEWIVRLSVYLPVL